MGGGGAVVWDVAVVGAGPGGCTLARLLAGAGARVLLLERDRLPRYKPCGGGVTAKAWPWLPPEAAAAVRWEVAAAELAVGDRQARLDAGRRLGGPAVRLVMRDEFDAALARAATAAGATLRDGARVVRLREGPQAVTVELEGGEAVTAAFVAVAAGALGASLFPGRPPRFVPALEVELAGDGRLPAVWGDFGSVATGYAWTFPKRDILSVGVASWARRPHGLRSALQAYLRRAGWADLPVQRLQGHPISVGGSLPGSELATARILRLGDAAGMADPIFGEGIYYAVYAAHLAAPALLAALAGRGTLRAYGEAFDRRLRPHYRALAALQPVLYGGIRAWTAAAARWPALGARALAWAVAHAPERRG
jgi:geranylgeranyl reductase family protein